MKFDAGDEFSAKNDTLQVNYASSEYLPSYAAQLPHQNSSEMMKKILHDPIQSYFSIPHPGWHSPQKNKPEKSPSLNISVTSEK